MANVLIIDDEEQLCRMLYHMVKRKGHTAIYALTLRKGLEQARSQPCDVVFLDVHMPDGSGLEILTALQETRSKPEVIIMTGFGDPDGAEIAIKNGAWDYVEKPVSSKKITLSLNRVLQYRDDLKKIRNSPVALNLEGVVGTSPQMRACLDFVAQAANSDANTLITGETGTGKEIIARAIHINSPRSKKNFVVVDCTALPETLVESALFGHEKGAFTGADRIHEGMVWQADRGTLFLDEVGELPLAIQKTFLRVLQEHCFRPVGGSREIASDFRIIAATNTDLNKMAQEKRFREDLLYRLRSLTLEMPPLRDRISDIKELVLYHTATTCEKYEIEMKGFSPDFFDSLFVYKWPGNVRELFNTLEGVISKARYEPTLFPKHLPSHIRIKAARAEVGNNKDSFSKKGDKANDIDQSQKPPKFRNFRETLLAEAEIKYLHDLMSYTKGSVKEACQISGLGRTTLYNMMKKYGISRLGWPSSD